MTTPTPTDTTVTVAPSVPTAIPLVVTDAPLAPSRTARAKTLAKTTFTKLGVPMLAGATGALVIARSMRAAGETDNDSVIDGEIVTDTSN